MENNLSETIISIPLKNLLQTAYSTAEYDTFQIELNPYIKDYEENSDRLKENLLIIRETFRAICNSKMFNKHFSMSSFYIATGIQKYEEIFETDSPSVQSNKRKNNQREQKQATDYFNSMLEAKNITNSKYYKNMAFALIKFGLPEQYLTQKKIESFSIIKNKKAKIKHDNILFSLSDLLYTYFSLTINEDDNEKNKKQQIAEVRAEKVNILNSIEKFLYKEYINGNPELLLIVTVCTRLVQTFLQTDELTVWKTTEALKDFMRQNMLVNDVSEPTSFENSRDFADFITTLAETINTVEEDFPEFYAVAQQMKEDKSAQSIMNEISNNLKSLQSKQLTMADVESDSCLNMVKNLTDIMLEIQNTISSAQKDAQDQALLAIEQLNAK